VGRGRIGRFFVPSTFAQYAARSSAGILLAATSTVSRPRSTFRCDLGFPVQGRFRQGVGDGLRAIGDWAWVILCKKIFDAEAQRSFSSSRSEIAARDSWRRKARPKDSERHRCRSPSKNSASLRLCVRIFFREQKSPGDFRWSFGLDAIRELRVWYTSTVTASM
jgi:hypothetical protein